jgi:hypothetical protein
MLGVYQRWTRSFVAPALVLGLLVACSDDKSGTGPENLPEGPTGDAAEALESVVMEFFEGNDDTFTSLETLGPLIGGALGANPSIVAPTAFSATALQSCLPVDVVGMTFEWDFSLDSYVPNQMSGAPADGVRFLLYQIDGSGNPQQGSVGHVDIDCPSQLPSINMTTTIVWNGVTIIDMSGQGALNPTDGSLSINIDGGVFTPDGSAWMGYVGGITQGQSIVAYGSGFTFDILPGQEIFAAFSRVDDTSGGFTSFAEAQKGLSQNTFEWAVSVDIVGDQSSLSGFVFLASLSDNGLIACAEGSWNSLQITEASRCTPQGEPFVDGVSAAEREAVRAAFLALRTIWEGIDGIVRTGVQAATSAVG